MDKNNLAIEVYAEKQNSAGNRNIRYLRKYYINS